MPYKVVFHWSFALCFLLCACNASASKNLYQHNINLFAQYADAHFVELDEEGDPYNEEDGSLLFSGLGLYWEFDSGLFTEINYKTAGDNLTYRGLSQLGLFIESETEYYIRDVHLLLGRNFGATSAYMGVGNNFRERNILGTETILGLYEEMDVTYGLFGLRVNLFANKPFQIRLNGNIATDLQSKLYIASERFDPVEIDPGKYLIATGSIEFLFHLFAGVTLSFIPGYEYTYIDESDSFRVYDDGIYEGDIKHPETEFENLYLTTKLSWYF